MNKTIKQVVFPITAAVIWGTAFAFQSMAAGVIGTFTFNSARSLIAAAVLLPVLYLFGKLEKKNGAEVRKSDTKSLIIGGILCGLALCAASNFQQYALEFTSAGKAGFITSLYIVLVPVFGLFLGNKVPIHIWGGVMIASVGLFLLCVNEEFTIGAGDVYVLVCAVIFAVHILLIDRFSANVNGIALSAVQFLTTGIVSGVIALFTETIDFGALIECALPILYVGIFSSGVAYTLQILAQKDGNPAVVSILLSLESVFSVIAGAFILGDKLSVREYIGCGIMFAAVILTQIPTKEKKKTE